MLKISTDSWHYRFWYEWERKFNNQQYSRRRSVPPKNLCPYMRSIFYRLFFCATILPLLTFFLFISSLVVLNPVISAPTHYITQYNMYGSLEDSYHVTRDYGESVLFHIMPWEQEKMANHPVPVDGLWNRTRDLFPVSSFGVALFILAIVSMGIFMKYEEYYYSDAGYEKRRRAREAREAREEQKDNGFLSLCLKYLKAKHEKICPALEFVDKE